MVDLKVLAVAVVAMAVGIGIALSGIATGAIASNSDNPTATHQAWDEGVMARHAPGWGVEAGMRERGGDGFQARWIPGWTGSLNLTQDEASTLLYLREKFKVARDFYLEMYDTWNRTVFKRLAAIEQRHMDIMLIAIDRAGLDDPVIPERGVFSNETLQQLYDNLVAQGTENETLALNASLYLTESNIHDLLMAIDGSQHPMLKMAYSKIARQEGMMFDLLSHVYKRATGAEYEPQLISGDLADWLTNVAPGPAPILHHYRETHSHQGGGR